MARFLSLPIAQIANPEANLVLPAVNCRLRAGHSSAPADAAQYAGISIARAVARNLRDVPEYQPLPTDPLKLRAELLDGAPAGSAITLNRLVTSLWARGIAVVQAEELPTGKFRGMACMPDGRPVIVLGFNDPWQPKGLVNIAHEVGHIAEGHVTPDCPMIDESGDDAGTEEEERAADLYGSMLISGTRPGGIDLFKLHYRHEPSKVSIRVLKQNALKLGKELGVDAALLCHFFACKHKNWPVATMAIKDITLNQTVKDVLAPLVDTHVDIEDASESDERLLMCLGHASTPSRQ